MMGPRDLRRHIKYKKPLPWYGNDDSFEFDSDEENKRKPQPPVTDGPHLTKPIIRHRYRKTVQITVPNDLSNFVDDLDNDNHTHDTEKKEKELLPPLHVNPKVSGRHQRPLVRNNELDIQVTVDDLPPEKQNFEEGDLQNLFADNLRSTTPTATEPDDPDEIGLGDLTHFHITPEAEKEDEPVLNPPKPPPVVQDPPKPRPVVQDPRITKWEEIVAQVLQFFRAPKDMATSCWWFDDDYERTLKEKWRSECESIKIESINTRNREVVLDRVTLSMRLIHFLTPIQDKQGELNFDNATDCHLFFQLIYNTVHMLQNVPLSDARCPHHSMTTSILQTYTCDTDTVGKRIVMSGPPMSTTGIHQDFTRNPCGENRHWTTIIKLGAALEKLKTLDKVRAKNNNLTDPVCTDQKPNDALYCSFIVATFSILQHLYIDVYLKWLQKQTGTQ
jgi:hypothetical protein